MIMIMIILSLPDIKVQASAFRLESIDQTQLDFALGQTIRSQKKNLSRPGSINRNLLRESWERNRVTQDAAFHRSADM